MPFVLFNLPFWRLEVDELSARAGIRHPPAFAGKELSISLSCSLKCLLGSWSALPHRGICTTSLCAGEHRPGCRSCAHHPPPRSWPFASPHPKARRKHWPSWIIMNVIPIFEITDAFNGNFSFKVSFRTLWLCEAYLHGWYLKITVNDLSNFIWTLHLDEKNKEIFRLKRKGNQLGDT